MLRCLRPSPFPGLVGVAIAVVSATAWAQTPEDPSRVREGDALRAQQLFDEALQLADAQRWTEACPKFRESLAADPGVGTLLNVASCSAREGKALESAREYRRVLELNASTKDEARRTAVESEAKRALKDLAARLGTLAITVTPEAAAYRLTIDGVAAPSRGPIEVEIGAHTVRVEADGFKPAESSVSVVGGQAASLSFSLTSSAAQPPAPPSARGDRLATAGWITGLLGAGGLATGTVLITLAADRASAVRAECGANAEPPSCPQGDAAVANEIASEGSSFATGGYVALGVGGAAVAAGIGLLIGDAITPRAPEAPTVSVVASSDGFLLVAAGSFQ
jgi:hypothetical protein